MDALGSERQTHATIYNVNKDSVCGDTVFHHASFVEQKHSPVYYKGCLLIPGTANKKERPLLTGAHTL